MQCEGYLKDISGHATEICRKHRYKMLPETQKKPHLSSIDRYLSTLSFYKNICSNNFFCGHNILTEGVFVTQLSSNAGISVSRIVWVTTNCSFMSDVQVRRGFNSQIASLYINGMDS
jgi:hypothetical protein